MSWTVMVWVAEYCCQHRLCSERANDGVVARSIPAVVSLDTSIVTSPQLSARGVVHRHLIGALNRVVGGDEGELRSCGALL